MSTVIKVALCQSILLSIVSAGLVSCKGRTEHALSERKMVALLTDLQLAQAYVETELMGSDSDSLKMAITQGVLKQHGVTQEELDSSYSYYGRNIDIYASLYEKVDKKIESKRKKFIESESKPSNHDAGIWEYEDFGVITAQSNSDGWNFSLTDPDFGKGESIVWQLHLSEPKNLEGVLGAEYDDGSGEATTVNLAGRNGVSMKFTSDTSKTVKRIYGTLRVKDPSELPVFADSISLKRISYDSLDYSGYRRYRRYNTAVRRESGNDSSEKTAADTLPLLKPVPLPETQRKPIARKRTARKERLK